MSPALLALQHIACEPPAAFEDEARARGLDLVRVELDGGEEAPDWREFDPMGAYEDEAHSWLSAEKRALAEAARSGHPVWGVCLGAQLLAAALGARVYPGRSGRRARPPITTRRLPIGTPTRSSSTSRCRPRSLFGRWLEHAVGVPRRAVG